MKLIIIIYLWLPGIMPLASHLESFWGVQLVEMHQRTMPVGCRRLSNFNNRACWRAVSADVGSILGPDRVVLALLPPLRHQGRDYYAGLGTTGLALAHCRRGDLELCGVIAAHEIGHALGLPHAEAGIMSAIVAGFKWGWRWRR